MKKNYVILMLFLLTNLASFAQITFTLSVCGSNTFNMTGVDITGRNMYVDAGSFVVRWNSSLTRWEIVQLPSTVWYYNTFASLPDPPCATTGTWVGPMLVITTLTETGG